MVVIIAFRALIFTVEAADTTVVSIDPSSQIVSSESNFIVNVSCAPGQAIKSFELKLSFNATLLQVNSVTEGDIFSGYNTYFNSGSINNSSGTIVDVYCLIVGSGNVTGNGTLVSINFTAKNVTGTSTIGLYDVGVTNETEYVSITVNNGTVQVDATPPEFVDNSPASGTTGDVYTFNVSVTDNVDTADELTVKVDWSHGSQGGNETMTNVGGNYFEKTVTLDQNTTSSMTYNFYANDTYGNSNTTTSASITVQDNDPPQLSGVSATPSTQEVGGYVNITAVVVDNIEAAEVFLNITYPDSSIENISITGNKTGNVYFCNRTYSIIGLYTFFIWANDTSSQSNVSAANIFVIGDETSPELSSIVLTTSDPLDTNSTFGWVNITCDVTDNVAVGEVYLNITNPDGSFNNVSMNALGANSYYYNSSVAFSTYGNYSYFIWANDSSDNQNSSSSYDFSMPPNWDVDMNGECKVFDLTLVSNHYGETGSTGWIREDVDNNGQIQILDLVFVSNHYNESWWV